MEHISFKKWFAGRWWLLLLIFVSALRNSEDFSGGERFMVMLITGAVIIGLMYWYWNVKVKDKEV